MSLHRYMDQARAPQVKVPMKAGAVDLTKEQAEREAARRNREEEGEGTWVAIPHGGSWAVAKAKVGD